MNNALRLHEAGCLITAIELYRSRPKSHGYMWDGRVELRHPSPGLEFVCKIWYYGGDTVSGTEALRVATVKGVRFEGIYYDAYWHCILATDSVWLHKEGWAGFEPDRRALAGRIAHWQKNPNLHVSELTEADKAELGSLGFVCVLTEGGNSDEDL